MKNVVLKATMTGLMIGTLMSFNMMFVGIDGNLAYLISLGFLLDSLPLTEDAGWIVGILFFVLVYTLYGAIIGFLIKKFLKE